MDITAPLIQRGGTPGVFCLGLGVVVLFE